VGIGGVCKYSFADSTNISEFICQYRAGFGRTDTKSLQAALEILGFGPCYYMAEVLPKGPKEFSLWEQAGAGKPDWYAIFETYKATVDFPACSPVARPNGGVTFVEGVRRFISALPRDAKVYGLQLDEERNLRESSLASIAPRLVLVEISVDPL